MEKIVEKVKKLLALSKDQNSLNEATTALAHAQRLILKYKIDEAVLNEAGAQEIQNFGPDKPLDVFKANVPSWKSILANSIAKNNYCKTYTTTTKFGNKAFVIVGSQEDADLVRYLYDFSVREIERLMYRDCKGKDKNYRNEYKIGAVVKVGEKLKQAAEQAHKDAESEYSHSGKDVEAFSKAIVLLNSKKSQLEEFLDKNLKLKPKSAKLNFNGGARNAGYNAADEINFHKSIGSKEKLLP